MDHGIINYKSKSDDKYALYSALLYAYQSINVPMKDFTKNVVVLTSNDNPIVDDPLQIRQVQDLLNTYKSSDINLNVIGLSETWDDELLFKDLQILSGSFDEQKYKKLSLFDLEKKKLYPCKAVGTLKLRLNESCGINVSVYSVIG